MNPFVILNEAKNQKQIRQKFFIKYRQFFQTKCFAQKNPAIIRFEAYFKMLKMLSWQNYPKFA